MEIWAGVLAFLVTTGAGATLMHHLTRGDRKPIDLVFRSIEHLPPGFAGGCNPWGGVLEIDRAIGADEGEQLRAAVERYRSRMPWVPVDGDRFRLVAGELVRR